MKEAGRQVYFQDVKLQMDAKLWGEEYNQHRPPKKVDFFQTYIIELKGAKGCPLYCVEHLIEGDYIKYNSNSGFVSDVNRLTPHAFSHFTFERSQHQLIIVDIQGVGDLYTDPQMHTVDQRDYGEANLGTKGMALFFSSHICNPICLAMGLTQFDLSSEELDRLQDRKWKLASSAATKIHPSQSEPVLASMRGKREDGGRGIEAGSETTVRDAFKQIGLAFVRNPPLRTGSGSLGYLPPGSPLESPGITMTHQHFMSVSEDGAGEDGEDGEMGEDDAIEETSSLGPESSERYMGPPHAAVCYSSSVQTEFTRERGEEKGEGASEKDSLKILGLIHWELAVYHELGRFSQDQVPDLASVRFHLETAAACTLPSALYTLARIYLQLPHDSFKDISVTESAESEKRGMEYLQQAAEAGHRAAMIELAKHLDTGSSAVREQNWENAAKWYSRALETPSGASDATDTSCQATESANPDYIITARLAEMFRSGGHRLEKDPNKAGELYTQSAEVAMEMMKGKLANKYYMLAEEAWSEVGDGGET
ncbi:Eukaryotic elongation factor 2 kinase [Geodia barretti]|nr:Eukaryotic elongation factor 2 kinase [Geodia barretti]